jgi:hypothetical protein
MDNLGQTRIRNSEFRPPAVGVLIRAPVISRGIESTTRLEKSTAYWCTRTVDSAGADFSQVWDAHAPQEQSHILQVLIEQVSYDGANGSLSVTLLPTGIMSLREEISNRGTEANKSARASPQYRQLDASRGSLV